MQSTKTSRRRGRGGKAPETLQLVARAKGLLEDLHPHSIWGVCYQLFVNGWLRSMAKLDTDKVSKHLVWAGEEGMIPWLVLMVLTPVPLSGFADTLTVTSASALQSALNTARAGDEILVGDGTYSGTFAISKNSGTATSPIRLRAANTHQAVLKGSGDFGGTRNVGLTITRSHWIIEGLVIRDYLIGLVLRNSSANHVEVRHNIVTNFGIRGIDLIGSSDNAIHHNVVAFSPATAGYSSYGGILDLKNANRNRIEHNIVYSITNDGHQCGDAGGCSVGTKRGYGVVISRASHNVIRGNLVMDAAKATLRIFSVPGNSAPTDHNQVTDNILAFSEGGGAGVSDHMSSHNVVANNLLVDNYYTGWTAKGNEPGHNTFQHNTTIVTPFVFQGNQLNRADDGGSSLNTIIKDNVFYGTIANGGRQYLWNVDGWSDAVAKSHHNLFWRPGAISTWNRGVRFHTTDIREQPQFVDPQHGDFTLAPGSPGKGAASDGTDIGIAFNSYLKKAWAQHIFALPTQEQTTPDRMVSFPASAAHQYQVYVYIPDTTPFRGVETFTIEDQRIQRDYQNIIGRRWIGRAPQRWIYLGTHANSGSLNISWTRSDTAAKLFIRQLPTPAEAYAWMAH